MRNPRGTRFCVTFWSEPTQLEGLEENELVTYLVVGREIGKRSGKVHWHGYIELSGKRTMDGVKRLLGDRTCHVEIAKGTPQEARAYAVKENDIYMEFGEMSKGQGYRSDLADVRDMVRNGASLLEIADKHIGDFMRYHRGIMLYKDLLDREKLKKATLSMPEVIVYIGKSGCGKSWRCYHDPDYQRSGFQYMAQMSGKVYFDGYENEDVIWFDEFTGSTMPFGEWCRVCDMYGLRVETKGGSIVVKPRKVLISTTTWPAKWWANCEKYLEAPTQLYRRITKMYWCERPTDDGAVELLKDGWTATNKEEYDQLIA